MSEPVEVTLKPCPFCGSGAKVALVDNTGQRYCADHAWVGCTSCVVEGPECDTIAQAITAWNTRHEAHKALQETGDG